MKLYPALFAIATFAANAWAQQPHFDVDRYVTALGELEAITLDAERQRTMPRITDPHVADVLRTLFDTRILSARKYETQDLDFLLKICGKANEVNVFYVLFDAQSQIDSKDHPSDVSTKVQKLMQRNTEIFQDELSISLPFTIRCFATQMPLLTEFAESLPPEDLTETRKSGIRRVRDGIVNIYHGALTISGQHGITQANRFAMLDSMTETASVFSKQLTVNQRQLIAKAVDSALPGTTGPFHDHLLKIQKAMSTADCTGLCKF